MPERATPASDRGWHHAPVSVSALVAARDGDQLAFAQLIAPYTAELRVHCYRMVGSLTDAEDLLQETLVAAWRGLDGFAGRSSVRTWLYRIATNRCLNAIRAEKRRPAEPVPPFDPPQPSRRGEVTWLQPYPDALMETVADPERGPTARYEAREAIELAFITALQRLPARQTAVVVLCDVLGFSIAEAAAVLDTPPTAVKGALQRARATLDRGRMAAGGPYARGADPGEELILARRFADAFAADDIDGLVALLTDDAWLAMPPAPHEYHGPEAVTAFFRASARGRAGRRYRLVPTRANAQPAFGCYLADHQGTRADFVGVLVLTLGKGRIAGVTRFLDPELARAFGMSLAADA